MSRRPLGPGPGAYGLPTEIGFEKHDVRKKRLPQYSFGSTIKTLDKRVSPGPGAYKIEGITRYGINKAHHYTMSPLTPIPEKSRGPGPGAHDNHKKPIFKGTNAPAYSIGLKDHFRFKYPYPGPNAYMFGVGKVKPGIPSFSMGIITNIPTKPRSPGPAAYGRTNLNVKLKQNPAYTMTGNNTFHAKECGPGSNVYNLMQYKPGKAGGAYTFGVKHSEYAPPMIVECDNLDK